MNTSNEQIAPAQNNAVSHLTKFEKWLMAKTWRLWVAVILGGVLLLVIINLALIPFQQKNQIPFQQKNQNIYFGPFPSIIAIGSIVSQGIELFNGTIPDLSWNKTHLLALLALLISMFITPTLFVINWRRYLSADASLRESISIRKTLIGLTIGAMCVPVFIITPYLVFRQVQTGQSMYRSYTLSSNKDAITADLAYLAFKAQALYVVPQNLGGTGGHWKNIPIPDGTTRDLTFDDLQYKESPENIFVKGLLPQSQNKFILEVVNDTTLIITGIGSTQTENANFRNKDGQKGKIQVTQTITPNNYYGEIITDNM